MASAWLNSWGDSWGTSWQAGAPRPILQGGFGFTKKKKEQVRQPLFRDFKVAPGDFVSIGHTAELTIERALEPGNFVIFGEAVLEMLTPKQPASTGFRRVRPTVSATFSSFSK